MISWWIADMRGNVLMYADLQRRIREGWEKEG